MFIDEVIKRGDFFPYLEIIKVRIIKPEFQCRCGQNDSQIIDISYVIVCARFNFYENEIIICVFIEVKKDNWILVLKATIIIFIAVIYFL